jgi:hypothetical protein
MKIIRTYEEFDKIGKHKVIEQSNGIKIRLLKEPSEWYKEKQKEKDKKRKEKQEEIKIEHERQKLISVKMKEIAIRELEQEGKL